MDHDALSVDVAHNRDRTLHVKGTRAMHEVRTISIFVQRPWRDVYDAIWRPEDFARWATGLSKSRLRREGETWLADGPEGPIAIRFTAHNPWGVMDHHVDTGSGREVHVPMRVIANGDGAEVLLTLLRQPGMSDAKFAEDADWVARDLKALKALLEG